MSDDVVKANPRLRSRVMAGLALLSLIGAAAHWWIVPMVAAYWRSMPLNDAVRSMQWCLTLAFLPCVVFGYYQIRLARQIRSTEQFPPPGMAMIKDTIIVRGAVAERQAKIFMILGTLLFVVAIFGGYYVPWVMLHRILR